MAQNSGISDKKNAENTSEFQKVSKSYQTGWRYAEYAFQYGVSIVLCTLGGYYLDKWLDTGNIFLIIGVLLGSVGGFINLMRGLMYKKPAGTQKDTKDGK